jgi:hypothetical protein
MDGLSGMRIYESYTADTRLLPPKYKDAIQFIITGVSHRIQNNDWTTTISSISGPKYTGKGSVKTLPAIKSHALKTPPKKQDTQNDGPNGEFPVGNDNVQSNGNPGSKHEEIVLKAMRASFSKGQTEGKCARGTGAFARSVADILKGGKGVPMGKGTGGGDANQKSHRDLLVSLGWTQYDFIGLTRAQVIDIIVNGPIDNSTNKRIPWVAGDAVVYYNTDTQNGEHFHSQYYQNKLFNKNWNWATDNDDNFGTANGFVYNSKKTANVWNLYIFKIPILG